MRIFRKLMCFILSGFLFVSDAGAVGNFSEKYANAKVSSDISFDSVKAENICISEYGTNTFIYEKNSLKKVSASHSAKLMTLFIAGEKIRQGKLALSDKVTVSENAGKQPPPQIWIEKGERISVEELVKSITIGNSNDGCVALAEKIAGSEGKFVSLMNEKAKSLKMEKTHFEDCTGISEKSVTCAKDLSILCGRFFDLDLFEKYFNCYIDNVRDKKAQLVNSNRLVRFYKGIKGFKCWADCGCVGAVRGKMKICVVALGCTTGENRDETVRKLLGLSFENYRIFLPEIPKEFLEDISVTGGEKDKVSVYTDRIKGILLPREKASSVSCEFQREESLCAPVKKDEKVGKLICKSEDKKVLEVNLKAKSQIKKMNFKCGMEKLWLNLLNF